MLLEEWTGRDVGGWLMSEKFDGVRAIWDGKNIVSRNGKIFNAPDWFKASLPNKPLDGELVIEGGTLRDMVSVIRTNGGNWDKVRYMIFDTPSELPFRDRLASLAILDLPANCTLVDHRVNNGVDFMEMEERVFSRGGEGVVLRNPAAPYVEGRSQHILKFKRKSVTCHVTLSEDRDYE